MSSSVENVYTVATVAAQGAAPLLYSYAIPDFLQKEIQVGQLVTVPLRGGYTFAYVVQLGGLELAPPGQKLKSIREIVVSEPLFGPSLATLINFVSNYYLYPPGLCIKEILPGSLTPKLCKRLVLPEEESGQNRPLIGLGADLLKRLAATPEKYLLLQNLAADEQKEAKKLVAAGFLQERSTLGTGTVKPAYEWWVSPHPEPPASPRRLGTREKEFWELAKNGPAKALSYFANYLKNPLHQAKSLAAKKLIILEQRERTRDDPSRAIFNDDFRPLELSAHQKTALGQIEDALSNQSFAGFLLFGVTGSGKTEVYLRAAEKCLNQGREVLWLAPEIALTMGLEGRLKTRLGAAKLAVLHSGLTPAQRYDQWKRVRRGDAQVVLGARSAVFAPLENLGLIIVDEEHDGAYKQDDSLRYHGVDLARFRAKTAGAVVILGSATPSLESYQAALDGRLTLLEMPLRAGGAVLPQVEIIDQRQETPRRRSPLSAPLKRRLAEVFKEKKQALLFVNRRGLSNIPICLSCGEVLKCPHCSISLTLHGPDRVSDFQNTSEAPLADLSQGDVLLCHRCGYRADPPKKCPACQSEMFRYFGVGTEKLLNMTSELFPEAKGSRLDADSIRHRGGLKKILKSFGQGELDFLVGTQMAAKGHDFPNLLLVGVVEADLGLNMPDFRAAERTFQLLSQVSGRAGRAEEPGRVLIQTNNPNHYALINAARHDYQTFFQNEIAIRAELGYPPFSRLALVRFLGPDETALAELAEKSVQLAQDIIVQKKLQLDVFGPMPSPVARVKNNFRYQFLLRSLTVKERHQLLNPWLSAMKKIPAPEMRFIVDIDPYQML